jgi:hypothetical protein
MSEETCRVELVCRDREAAEKVAAQKNSRNENGCYCPNLVYRAGWVPAE